jgi:hypothetical protein
MVMRKLGFSSTFVGDSSHLSCRTDRINHYARIQCFKISGTSTPDVHGRIESHGSVFKPARAGLIIKLARIEGKIIKTIKKAQAHGLELAIEWVDSEVLLSSKNPAS